MLGCGRWGMVDGWGWLASSDRQNSTAAEYAAREGGEEKREGGGEGDRETEREKEYVNVKWT